MKNYNYKLVIVNAQIYREVVLSGEFERQVYVGTTTRCAIRFGKENYAQDFEICVQKQGDRWQIVCGETVRMKSNRLFLSDSKFLKPGESTEIQFKDSEEELMQISFLLNFSAGKYLFDGYVNISGIPSVSIGRKEYCNLVLPDEGMGMDEFHIIHDAEGVKLQVISSENGIFLNGFQVKKGVRLITGKDFIMAGGYEFFLNGEKLYLTDSKNIGLNGVKFIEEKENVEFPHFHRTTRVKAVLPKEKIEILPPKSIGKKPERNLLLTLAPVFISMILMVVLRTAMGSGGYYVIYSVAMMALGVITSVFTYRNEGKEYRKLKTERETQYLQYLSQTEDKIRQMREKERQIREETYISLEEAVAEVERFDSCLFERSMEDEDFLVIRLGTGKVEAAAEIQIKEPEYKETEDKLMEYPGMLAQQYRYIDHAPICVDLKQMQCLGIVGDEENSYQMLKNITLDLAIRHHYHDVKFIYFLQEQTSKKYEWIRWLKNLQDGKKRRIVYDEKSRKNMMEELYGIFSVREGLKKEERKHLQRYVVFVCGEQELFKHPVSQYIEECGEYGISFIFFQDKKHHLPKGCGNIVILDDDSCQGKIINSDDQEQEREFTYSTIPEEKTEEISLRLGSVDMDEINLEGGLTKHISLYELLHVVTAEDLNLGRNWESAQIYKSMAAPLGVRNGNEIVYLDLNEKHHGPHGLVAGTTGSGKSEILLSYILSMAVRFHPYEVGFVIIDFKGGGMANQLKELPHLISTITNIDGKELTRSLLSIKAELRKRQKVFAEYEVNHIDDYIQKYKKGETEIALPHLILVVDEFAELKASQPEFMQELISAARIGRSLGVHLILATQKPAGVVNDQIWSNSKFKLCLKVQNKNDSNEILKSPLAAEIREPGRAYLQVGNNEIFELFQSAYSGEPADSLQVENIHEYRVCELGLDGREHILYEKRQEKKKGSQTQLEAVVDYVGQYCREKNIRRLPGICLPALKECLEYPVDSDSISSGKVRIGVADKPEQQLQEEIYVDFAKENVFILGSSQYGKTNFLMALIKGAALNESPEQINFYILDFASMGLKQFENLRHVGGVITSAEDEKLENFLKMMEKEIAHRREILSGVGLSSFAAYLEAGYHDLPQIVILVDNLTVLRELYFQQNDRLLPICREGLAIGISVVIANSQSAGVGFRYMSNFSKRIAFYCNNASEYHALFEHCRVEPAKTAGRGIIELEKNIYEFQSYLAFPGEKEVERVENMRSFVEAMNGAYPGMNAKPIPQIPGILTESWMRQFGEGEQDKIASGLDYETMAPIVLDYRKLGIMGFVGRNDFGKKKFLYYLFHRLKKQSVQLFIIDDAMQSLGYLKDNGAAEYYCSDLEQTQGLYEMLNRVLQDRSRNLREHQLPEDEVYQLLLIQSEEFLGSIQKNKEWLELCKLIANQGAGMKLGIWLTNVPNAPVVFSSPEPLKLMKEKKQAFVFEGLEEQKVFDVPMSMVRNHRKPLSEGDAYYVMNGNVRKMKTVTVTEE